MPSARLFLACALVTVALVGSVAVPGLAWVALGADLLLLAAVALDRARAAAVPLEAARTWPPLLVQGAPAAVEVEVRTAPRVGRAAPARGAASRARRRLAARAVHGPRRRPAPLALRADLPPARHPHGAAADRARAGPWGLAWSQRTLLAPQPQRVYPQVRWQGEVGRLLALAHRRELGRSPVRLSGIGSEPYALREYRPGDPPLRIHWKASARHDRLISREDTWERGARLLILLDCGRAMAAQDGGRSKLDHALAAALALTRVAASRGDRVTVMAFSDRVERTVRVRGGTRSADAAYRELFDLEARLVEPAYDLAAEQARQAGVAPRARAHADVRDRPGGGRAAARGAPGAAAPPPAAAREPGGSRPGGAGAGPARDGGGRVRQGVRARDRDRQPTAGPPAPGARRARRDGAGGPLAWETLDVYLRTVLGARRSAALSRRPGRPSRAASAAGTA
jgi:uncharacterized protein (DUF58 family)